MKILITGGAGYIGQALVRQLIERNANIEQIYIYDNLFSSNYNFFFSKGYLSKNIIQFIQGELLDSRKLRESLQGIDVVYHLAAKVSAPFSDLDSHYFEQINHWGTAELVNLIEESQVKQFINLSSISVYGISPDFFDEESEPHPVSFYGISKLRGERHVKRLFKKLPKVFNIRAANAYGYNPCIRMDAVINRFMLKAHYNNRISIHGNGEQRRVFVHIDKVAEVLAKIPTSDLETGTYNLAEHNFSVNEISQYLKEIYPTLETLYINQHIRMDEVKIQTPCKILEKIPYQSKTFLEELQEFKERFTF
jgi:UDP-glucose 4-epimerase